MASSFYGRTFSFSGEKRQLAENGAEMSSSSSFHPSPDRLSLSTAADNPRSPGDFTGGVHPSSCSRCRRLSRPVEGQAGELEVQAFCAPSSQKAGSPSRDSETRNAAPVLAAPWGHTTSLVSGPDLYHFLHYPNPRWTGCVERGNRSP